MTLCIFIRIVQLWLHLDLSFVWKICCSKMFLNIRKYFYIIMKKVTNGFLDTLRILRNVNHILVWTNSFQDFNNISNFIHSRRKHVYHPLIHFLSYLQLKACIICSTFILWSKTGSIENNVPWVITHSVQLGISQILLCTMTRLWSASIWSLFKTRNS